MKIKLLDQKCYPSKAHNEDAGFDLKNASGDVKIGPYEEMKIRTGIALAIPVGYVGLLVPRSSIGKRGIQLQNTIGVIDSTYRGEIIALIKNTKEEQIEIKAYERFAQLIIMPFLIDSLDIVDSLPETARGEGGFGSTGTH